jgi:hypothetical protein
VAGNAEEVDAHCFHIDVDLPTVCAASVWTNAPCS